MSRVSKAVIACGTHRPPEGPPVVVTPERLRHWSEQHRRMTAAGLKVPVCWGHQSRAVPLDPNDPSDAQYLSSRYNAGYAESLIPTPDGRLVASANTPGMEADESGNLVAWTRLADGREVKAAVSEVSIGIAKKFKDGAGRVWDDVITHIAVTPHPVWSGQDGFTKLGGLESRVEGLVVLGSADMADETMTDDSMLDDVSGDDVEVVPPPPPPPADGPEANLAKLLPALAEHGITLPEGTDDENFVERLYVAITALQGKLTPMGAGDVPQEGPVTQQEPDAVMMSLLASNPNMPASQRDAIRKLAEQNKQMREREQRRRAETARRRIEKHVSSGRIPASVASKHFGAEPGTVYLSLNSRPPGELAAFEAKLSLLDDLRPYLVSNALMNRTVNAVEIENPTSRPDTEQAKVTDEMARMAGVK